MNKGSIKLLLEEATMRQSEAGFGGQAKYDSNKQSVKDFCEMNTDHPLSPDGNHSPIVFDKKVDINK